MPNFIKSLLLAICGAVLILGIPILLIVLGLGDALFKVFDIAGKVSIIILFFIIMLILFNTEDTKLATIALLLIIISCVYTGFKLDSIKETEYNRGYDDGIEEADNTHYFDYDEGYEDGYDVAIEELQQKHEDELNDFYNQGYEDGFYDGTENNEWGYSYNN